jgi:hypothetical protein
MTAPAGQPGAETRTTTMPTLTSRRIPVILTVTAVGLAAVGTIPAMALGGRHALGMMALGALTAWGCVLGGWWIARFAFRGPDVFATKLVVGGFIVRVGLLILTMVTLVAATGIEPGGFVLWLVSFYFALLLVEAWILAREHQTEGPKR